MKEEIGILLFLLSLFQTFIFAPICLGFYNDIGKIPFSIKIWGIVIVGFFLFGMIISFIYENEETK